MTVNGEVTFTGNYALTKKNERLSDLIAKAGGLSKSAYAKRCTSDAQDDGG